MLSELLLQVLSMDFKIKNGFTLIETLIYAVLTVLIIGFTILTLYQVITSADQLKAEAAVHDELNFVSQKIHWALDNATAINLPLAGQSGSSLSVTKRNFAQNPIVFDFNNGNARVKFGAGEFVTLDNDAVIVDLLLFEHIDASGAAPEGVKTTITVHSANYPSTTLASTSFLRK